MALLLDEVRLARSLPDPEQARSLRLAAGISLERMAAELKVNPVTLYRWEAGHSKPRRVAHLAYAQILSDLAAVIGKA
jgi:transcriptional regulator with XRE-family HTH domain